jgi:membrane protease YdiL (CAAX protease family)
MLRIVLMVTLGFVIVGPLLGLQLAMAFYEGDLMKDIGNVSGTPQLATAILIMQATATLVGLIILPLIQITRLEGKQLQSFFPNQEKLGLMLLIVAGIGLIFPIAMSPLSEWNANLSFPDFMSGFERWAKEEEERLAKITSLITEIDSVPELIVGIFVIGLLPAIGEELVFRGMIQQELWRGSRNIHLAIWTSAFIFSAIHVQFFGFVPRLLLGALFGYLYYWSGNLLIPMFSHFFNNTFAVVMLYLYHTGSITLNVEEEESAPIKYVIPCVILSITLLYYTRQHYLKTKDNLNFLTGDEH